MKNLKVLHIPMAAILVISNFGLAGSLDKKYLQEVAEKYETYHSAIEYGSDSVRLVKNISSDFAKTTPLGALATGSDTLNFAIDYAIDAVEGAAHAKNLSVLQAAVAESATNYEGGIEAFQYASNEEQIAIVAKSLDLKSDFMIDITKDMDVEGKVAIQEHFLKILEKDSQNLFAKNRLQDIDIEKHKKEFKDFLSEYKDLSLRINNRTSKLELRHNDLVSSHEKLQSIVAGNGKSIDNLSREVGGIQSILFDGMNPKEQLEAIRKGQVPATIISEDALAVIELQVSQMNFKQEVNGVFDDIRSFGQLGMNLANISGVDANLGNFIDTVNKGQVAFNAAMNFSVNPIGSLVSLTGLFAKKKGGGGLGKAIKKLLEGQRKIMENQKLILQGQDEIKNMITKMAELNQKIAEKISKQISSEFNFLNTRVTELFKRVDNVAKISLANYLKDARHCKGIYLRVKRNRYAMDLLESNNSLDTGIDSSILNVDPQRIISSAVIGEEYKLCSSALTNVFENSEDVFSADKHWTNNEMDYALSTHSSYGSLQKIQEEIYAPLYDLMTRKIISSDDFELNYFQVLDILSFGLLDEGSKESLKNSMLDGNFSNNKKPIHNYELIASKLKIYQEPNLVLSLSKAAIDLLELSFFPREVDKNISDKNILEYVIDRRVLPHMISRLAKIEDILSVSIIQENILSGEFLASDLLKLITNRGKESTYVLTGGYGSDGDFEPGILQKAGIDSPLVKNLSMKIAMSNGLSDCRFYSMMKDVRSNENVNFNQFGLRSTFISGSDKWQEELQRHWPYNASCLAQDEACNSGFPKKDKRVVFLGNVALPIASSLQSCTPTYHRSNGRIEDLLRTRNRAVAKRVYLETILEEIKKGNQDKIFRVIVK